jgi:hypothetical protein
MPALTLCIHLHSTSAILEEQLISPIFAWLEKSAACRGDVREDSEELMLPCCTPNGADHLQPAYFEDIESEMDVSETGSVVSSSTRQVSTSLEQRPILVPKPPSTKRSTKGSRSPSPTRKLLFFKRLIWLIKS